MVGKNKIKELIELVEESNINEIVVSSFWGLKRIRISKTGSISTTSVAQPIQVNPVGKPQTTASTVGQDIVNEEGAELQANQIEVKAPLVGTFYAAGKPGEPAFAKLGDMVNVGQTICIIEAMKIFNEIDSDFSGKVVKILVQNEEPVEFDQTLMILETA
ncbi:MAG: acetyl-CoA carboxylase biotin carboxyl carrier protein [Candidatus Marinimicrobia bacterium]|jgi:acetyl-CoA carboxylase biotin carboxyl carrier protein|nr:acetyl-CoA carboxylase biotin carboxyl carrier protein [Candidatus Neomarinimicrobiota bacterium]MBT3633377.1 acetyl-CoA carboxylase biotin carboxyl carrier protein [Candidatus Neomarinimicrobiota bacterium]MBT3681520.1 acetyl-CoA carboxylase biotin carboxyl carrier protein [Candidatus Neomarinimicrobiota bacterium]MBT3758513.1 acetyl-CoA carboxylase biotin carboxyl carrier protein [Candidatus Neomarinimicrobiota bacterium]MBT3894833.1 acetyl-CoA carboxylase biotin carboxyl carrier protein [